MGLQESTSFFAKIKSVFKNPDPFSFFKVKNPHIFIKATAESAWTMDIVLGLKFVDINHTQACHAPVHKFYNAYFRRTELMTFCTAKKNGTLKLDPQLQYIHNCFLARLNIK
jgi:hypothetical protein